MIVRISNDQPSSFLGPHASRVLFAAIYNPGANLHASVSRPGSRAEVLTEGPHPTVNGPVKVTHDPSVARPLLCNGSRPQRIAHFAVHRISHPRCIGCRSRRHASEQISAHGAAVNRLLNSGAPPRVGRSCLPLLTQALTPIFIRPAPKRNRIAGVNKLSFLRSCFSYA